MSNPVYKYVVFKVCTEYRLSLRLDDIRCSQLFPICYVVCIAKMHSNLLPCDLGRAGGTGLFGDSQLGVASSK